MERYTAKQAQEKLAEHSFTESEIDRLINAYYSQTIVTITW